MFESEFFLPTITDGEDKGSILKNRIRKNYRHIRKWAKRTQTNAFRIYDRDIKEYPLTIDFYAGRFYVQLFSFDREEEEIPTTLQQEIEELLHSLFLVQAQLIYWRTRIKRKKIEQYEKIDHQKEFFTILEYGAKFKINLHDYLDTGLFLDHRETRQLVSSLAKDKRVLNLFAYTCSFSIFASLGGATTTTSVDMSNTYTEWGRENFVLNDLCLTKNEILRADCMKFLKEAITNRLSFDLIIIDPPTISRSKKMDQFFDIQIDHVTLINQALRLLSNQGLIIFSTNSRKFKLDEASCGASSIIEISDKTLPLDFHNKKIHRCWKIFK